MNFKLKQYFKKHGSQKDIASFFGVSQQTISRWIHKYPDLKHVVLIEKYTNGAITKEELRPDIFK